MKLEYRQAGLRLVNHIIKLKTTTHDHHSQSPSTSISQTPISPIPICPIPISPTQMYPHSRLGYQPAGLREVYNIAPHMFTGISYNPLQLITYFIIMYIYWYVLMKLSYYDIQLHILFLMTASSRAVCFMIDRRIHLWSR